jgi:predicted nuclease of predicted toxin-antitoxin system
MIIVDNNLPARIAKELNRTFIGSKHVKHLQFEKVDDMTIWNFCKKNNFHIFTKDNDFEDLVLLSGCPPKVIHLVCGNQTTDFISQLIAKRINEIQEFVLNDKENCILILS